MCGICGMLLPGGDPIPRSSLEQMQLALAHRGPDDEGTWVGEGIGLGHRRLSIIDLDPRSKGPIANEDGSIIATFNGEIYNFQELREELLKKGHRFVSEGDSEVLVHLWEEEGPSMANRLRGMYAFAIWDENRRSLYLCRDRIGQKPLYLHRSHAGIAFASEIPALLKCPWVPRVLSPQAIHHYLALQYVPHPRTAWAGIEAVPPANWLLFENGAWKQERYWDLDFRKKTDCKTLGEAVEEFREKFMDAVRVRLVSDVPLGVFLSGGIDSGMVTAAMSRVSGSAIKTYTIGFQEEAWDERQWARQVAEMYGTDHTEEVVEPDAGGQLTELVRRYGQPYADPSAIPTWYVSQAARKHVTVALNGDGGDEGFAGYQRYLAEKIVRYYDRIPAPIRRGLIVPFAKLLPPSETPGTFNRRFRRFVFSAENKESYLQWICFFDPERRAGLYQKGFAQWVKGETEAPVQRLLREAPADHWLDKILYTDLHSYLTDDLMVKVDIASMSVGLEARSPFLDHHVMEFAASLPPKWKLWGFRSKHILKEAAQGWLPPALLDRRKMGFGVPLERWLRNDMKEQGEDLLLSDSSRIQDWFHADRIHKLWNEHQSRTADHSYRLWALLVLEAWLREFEPDRPQADGV